MDSMYFVELSYFTIYEKAESVSLLYIVYLNSPYPSNQRGRRKYNSDDSLFLHFGTSKDILKKRKVV